jgi:uncharacterized protein YggE
VPTEITVRGTFAVFQPPQRGTVHATLGFEGPDLQPVYERVARDLEAVKASIAPLRDAKDGQVTWWATQDVRTWSNRPWNKDGKQLPLVHHATVGIDVKFRDFAALSRWVGQHVAETAGFQLTRVEWTLTTKRRDALVAEVRTRAVKDAADRAQQYADALGLGPIRPVAIADAGMLGSGMRPEESGGTAYLRAAGSAAAPTEMELVPEDIEVSAAVDARFVAGTV